MNKFVDYLNSTNNARGNSTGSLAETQVRSEFFDKVKIDRALGKYIANTVRNKEYHTFILTGHAGDGKTSVLVQVLKDLGLLENGEGLAPKKTYPDFTYVKDMSEIAEDLQVDVLENVLNSPNQNKSGLLISNTGPLLNTFMQFIERIRKCQGRVFDREDRFEIKSKLLTQLDTNSDEEITVEGYKFYLINIARVDNVMFSTAILRKIVEPDLWEDCKSCDCADRCPIKNNVLRVNAQLDRVSRFIKSFYRFLYENDKRMTIRQMVGQISYAITGNLTCESIKRKYFKEPFFNYNFANLFFGCVGLNEMRDSSQIKGVAEIQLLGLDQVALDVDFQLFVNNDYRSFFVPELADELYELQKKHQKHYQIIEEEEATSASEHGLESKLRRAIRRFYLIFSNDLSEERIMNQIFGTYFSVYEKLIESKQPKAVLRNIQSLVFQALYVKNTGVLPNGTNELPLTLRRENSIFQNVMMVLGNLSKSDLTIVQKSISNIFEDTETRQELYLKANKKYFLLSLPMLSYFDNLVQGTISSNSNPALTHGIAKLDTMLLEEFGDDSPQSEEDCELKLLINTTSGQLIRYFSFEGNKLTILS